MFCQQSNQLELKNTPSASLHNKCPGYDTISSDGEAAVLELWGM